MKNFKNLSMLDAFRALDDMEDEDVTPAIKPSTLNESKSFPLNDSHAIDEAESFNKETPDKDIELEVIAPNSAVVDGEIDNSQLVGKYILKCTSCHNTRFEDVSNLEKTEDGYYTVKEDAIHGLTNDCPVCHKADAKYQLEGMAQAVQQEEPKFEQETSDATLDNDYTEEQPVEETPEETPVEDKPEGEFEDETKPYGTDNTEEDDTQDMESTLGKEYNGDDVPWDDTEDEPLPDEPEVEEENDAVELDDEEEKNEELEEAVVEDLPTDAGTVREFLEDNFIEPYENDLIVSVKDDHSETVEEERAENLSETDAVVTSWSTDGSTLIINIDSDDTEGITVTDALRFFKDEASSDKIDVWDQATGDSVFVGSKNDVLDKYGDCSFLSFECPETLVVVTDIEGTEHVIDEAKGEWYESLTNKICKANKLLPFRANKEGTREYWIKESLKSNEDLDIVFTNYVKSTGDEELIRDFKDNTGYKDSYDVAVEEAFGTAPKVDKTEEQARKEAEEILKNAKDKFAVIYGVGGNKFIAIDPVLCRDEEQLEDRRQIVNNTYRDRTVRVLYRTDLYEGCKCDESNFKTRKELAAAINECKEKKIGYSVKRSLKEGYRYQLLKESPEEPEQEVAPELPVAPEVVPEVEETGLVDPRDAELLNLLAEKAAVIANGIRDSYGVDVDEKVIVADMLQDLQLIAGNIKPENLAATEANNLTKVMFAKYENDCEAVDALISELYNIDYHSTTEDRVKSALESIASPAMDDEHLLERVRTPEFLDALQHSLVPGIEYHGNAEDVKLLDGPVTPNTELLAIPSLFEELKEGSELEQAKTDINDAEADEQAEAEAEINAELEAAESDDEDEEYKALAEIHLNEIEKMTEKEAHDEYYNEYQFDKYPPIDDVEIKIEKALKKKMGDLKESLDGSVKDKVAACIDEYKKENKLDEIGADVIPAVIDYCVDNCDCSAEEATKWVEFLTEKE